MLTKSLKMKILVMGLSLCSLIAVPNTAFASTTNRTSSCRQQSNKYLSLEQEQHLRKEFTKDDISLKEQNTVINKLKAGKVLDAENPEKIAQVPEEFFNIKKDGPSEKMYKFEDGSYIKLSVKKVKSNNKAVYHSHYSTEYENHYVEARYGVTRVGFHATFHQYQGSPSVIKKVYGTGGYNPIGTLTFSEPKIIDKYQSGSRPALAMATAYLSTHHPWGTKSQTFFCKLYVGASDYTVKLTLA